MRAIRSRRRRPSAPQAPSAADVLGPFLGRLLGGASGDELPVRIELWDGSALGEDDGAGTLVVRSPDALRRIVWAPGELGFARAFVVGEIDAHGDLIAMIEALRDTTPSHLRLGAREIAEAARAARRLGVLGRPPPNPPEEAHPRGRWHSLRRDAGSVSHHYDIGNDFYRLVLGESMTYSCARFATADMTLAEAQASKHELVSRKLGLADRPEQRLLDVGCGWGSMAIHAARHHGASVLGITLSAEQAALARRRVEEAGVADRVEIRLLDYRRLDGETFDAVSSIGMFEHVGSSRAARYFEVLRTALRPGGRLLNHAISSVSGSKIGGRSFIGRYVFPDGELIDVARTQALMQDAGFEVRDVESLREHYARTLRHWVANLEAGWDRAVELVGERRARVWRLYMAASAVGFVDGGVNVHQVLGVVPDAGGGSGMPSTRAGW